MKLNFRCEKMHGRIWENFNEDRRRKREVDSEVKKGKMKLSTKKINKR